MNRSRLVILFTAALVICSLGVAAAAKPHRNRATGAEVKHVLLTPADLKWGPAPAGLPAGAKLAVLEGDPTKAGPFTIRLQMPSGYKVMPHTHPTPEKVTVISGTGFFGMGPNFDQGAARQLDAGGFVILPAGMQHFAFAKGETILQISSTGPFVINYVNQADDPRTAKP